MFIDMSKTFKTDFYLVLYAIETTKFHSHYSYNELSLELSILKIINYILTTAILYLLSSRDSLFMFH